MASKGEKKGPSMSASEIKLTLKSLYAHCAINMSVSMLTFSTRSELLLPLVGCDYNRVAVYMSGWTAATAALEFLVNPTIGKLSDAFGRRIFLLIAPVANIILKTWVLINPSIVSLTVERLICDGLRTLGGSTMGLAMLSDLLPQDQFAQGAATLVSFMGIGILASPIIASSLTAMGSYKLAIAGAFAQLLMDVLTLKESLPKADRKPDWSVTNPFSFLKLFTKSAKLRRLATISALNNCVDIKVTADHMMVYQQATLDWARQATQRFTAAVGLSMLFQSKVTKASMKKFNSEKDKGGLYGHTHFANWVAIVKEIGVGVVPHSAMMWTSGALQYMSGTRENALKQMATIAALEAGMGKGELQGYFANLRAAMCVLAAPVFARSLLLGRSIGLPGAPFALTAVFVFLSDMLLRNHRKAQAIEAKASSKPPSSTTTAPEKKAEGSAVDKVMSEHKAAIEKQAAGTVDAAVLADHLAKHAKKLEAAKAGK